MPDEALWNRLTAAQLRELAARDAVVLLPIGSTEQHGPHLPTGVDDLLAAEVCRRVLVRDRAPLTEPARRSIGAERLRGR